MIVHETASGHENDKRSRDRELPGERGNGHAIAVIGSGQKTATGHVESSPGEIGIDLRIETGLPESKSACAESGSDPKIATAHGATAHGATDRGRTATERMTASDALDRER